MFDTDLESFIVIAKIGSLSGAARKTGQDVGNLSRCLARLEKNRSCLLFIRHKTGMILTSEGEKLLQALLTAKESFNNSINKESTPSIRIGFSSAVGFGFFTKNLTGSILENKINPQFTILPTIELFELLKERKLDFVLSPRIPKFPGIIVKPMLADRLILCSLSGKMQKTLLLNSQMFEFEKALEKINYDNKWILDDYFVLGKILSERTELMGIIPEALLKIYPLLRPLEQFKLSGKMTAISWIGSPGVTLLKAIQKPVG